MCLKLLNDSGYDSIQYGAQKVINRKIDPTYEKIAPQTKDSKK